MKFSQIYSNFQDKNAKQINSKNSKTLKHTSSNYDNATDGKKNDNKNP